MFRVMRMHKTFCIFFMLLFTGLSFSIKAVAVQSQLNFSLLVVNGEQRDAYVDVVRKFERHYPSIKVNLQVVEQESYKKHFELWLNAASRSDVMFWFGGERLHEYANQGLIESLDDLWERYDWYKTITPSACSAILVEAKEYGLPVHYYNWGIYYNKALFKKLQLKEPQTWDQFLAVCAELKRNGIAPIALGSKDDWPVAGWFDYLNLRLNGLSFHYDLLKGKVSYRDERVLKVFAHLKEMVNKNLFIPQHAEETWKSILPYLYRDMAGMMLMGNFWTSQLPPSMSDKFAQFRFPQLDENIPFYEEAPTDLLVIPANAQNKKDAAIFLNFMAGEDIQFELNEKVGMLPPQQNQPYRPDSLLGTGADILRAAQGLSQYYDRDAPQIMATEGLKLLKRFVENPENLEDILSEFERLRVLSYKSGE